MDNKQKAQFDFCPKCGALARDGVCTSCGYRGPEAKQPNLFEHTDTEENGAGVFSGQSDYYGEKAKENDGFENGNRNSSDTNNSNSQDGYSNNGYYSYEYGQDGYYSSQPTGDTKKKNRTGMIIGIVCGGILIFALLVVGVINVVYSVVKNVVKEAETEFRYEIDNFYEDELPKNHDDFGDDDWWEKDSGSEYDYDYFDFYKELEEKYKNSEDNEKSETGANGKTYGFSAEDDYYKELKDCLDDDLDYSIEFESDTYTDMDGNVVIEHSYPVISGQIPNRDGLNEQIKNLSISSQVYEQTYKDRLADDEIFEGSTLGYVTFMSEDILSVVVWDTYGSNYEGKTVLSCLNIDVQKGVVIKNTDILQINDSFSIDFRNREQEQNSSDNLTWYTDQELTAMLQNSDSLILFYTPLGMEVGVNYDLGWATVTYKDYENYLKEF